MSAVPFCIVFPKPAFRCNNSKVKMNNMKKYLYIHKTYAIIGVDGAVF